MIFVVDFSQKFTGIGICHLRHRMDVSSELFTCTVEHRITYIRPV